jgi:regulator of protease activity HflC (stomatin/prohibitin superfamily)
MTFRELRQAVGAWLDRNLMRITVAVMVAAFLFLLLINRIVVTVPAGHAGVLWKRFGGGTVVDRIYGEGIRLILPWNEMTIYDMRFQHVQDEYEVVDRDGLRMTLAISTRLRLVPEFLGYLHQDVGPNYLDVVLRPEVGSHARTIVAEYTAEDVYATKRAAIEDQILDRVRKDIVVHGREQRTAWDFIQVEDILIRTITLPPLVAAAIEQKIQQFHVVKEWQFRLQREELESQRKAIEAEGIRQFQAKVAPGISDQYLKWKGIDATLKLAESPNAKTVIIGSGPTGLPVILGSEGAPPPVRPGPAPRADAPVELQPARPATSELQKPAGPPLPPVPPALPPPAAAAPPASPGAEAPSAPPAAAAPPQPARERGVLGALFDRVLGVGR